MTAKKTVPARKRRDATDRLYRAVCAYVESKGGTALVVGGIQVIQWPTDAKFNYTLGIKVTGKVPEFAKEPKP